jgi:cob(I)alamin adenosyltransferase
MVKLDKIYTRGGDGGETSIQGGDRLNKNDARIEAIGVVDETNAAIGAARLHLGGGEDAMLGRVQDDLFDLGADLANADPQAAGALRIAGNQVARLETEIDVLNESLAPLDSFVLPGGAPAAAALHVARTVCRRAERRAVGLAVETPINGAILRYLNRLSDLLFVMARKLNDDGARDVLWRPGANR